jgi:hypothetical protein
VKLPLQKMTVAEKLEVMEALWEDLSRNSSALESPAWHKEALRLREDSIASGKSTFRGWEEAKADIRRQVE